MGFFFMVHCLHVTVVISSNQFSKNWVQSKKRKFINISIVQSIYMLTVQQGNNLQLVDHFSLSILRIHTFCPHFLIFLPKTHLQCCLVSPKQMPATQRYNYIILVTISICCIKISLSVKNMKTNKQKQYHFKGTLFTTDQTNVYTTC